MGLEFFDAGRGRMEPLRASLPPQVDFLWDRGGDAEQGAAAAWRSGVLVSGLLDSMVHLGLTVNQAVEPVAGPIELFWGGRLPAAGAKLWLRPGPVSVHRALEPRLAAAAAAGDVELRYACLKTHYRRPLVLEPGGLAAAVSELSRLRAIAARLAVGAAPAANSRGLAGYLKRLRDALSRDLDLPAAIETVWDALRPGALSPGSQLEALRKADEILGLGLVLK